MKMIFSEAYPGGYPHRRTNTAALHRAPDVLGQHTVQHAGIIKVLGITDWIQDPVIIFITWTRADQTFMVCGYWFIIIMIIKL